MTEEEIKKKAEEYANEKCKDCYMCSYSECKNPYKECWKYNSRKQGIIAGAKLMQKENDRLAKHILELQKDKGRLTDENNKLLDVINNQDVKIADLEKKVKYYEQQLSAMEKGVCDVCKVKDADYYENQIADLEKKVEQAKAITSRLYETCNSSARLYGYSLLEGDKKEIEQFISEVEK